MTLVVADGRIKQIVPISQQPAAWENDWPVAGRGGVVTPGLIDCHTHLVFGGNRAGEFEQRLEGASYAEIAAQGGGILSTVNATRAATEDDLFASAKPRLEALIADGVTTVEIKSGYGLSLEHERKMLRVARRLGQALPVDVVTTFLGAHALPPEYKGRADDYITVVCEQMLPALVAEKLVDAVDVFCENIAFSIDQCERVFIAARQHGLPVKGHVEQLSNQHGSELCARYQGLSVDHIEWLDDAGIAAIKRSGTVATLLPGAFYTLRDTTLPPVKKLRQAGVPMAVATDANPGSSPIFQLTLMLNMACTLFRLTPTEALQGVTQNAARALGLGDTHGILAEGRAATFCHWQADHPAELAYSVQPNRLLRRVYNGEVTSL
jgi:imidazolonepropionase